MGNGYICQRCGLASGYHKDEGDKFGKCLVTGEECEEFIWSDEDWKKYLKRHSQTN